MADESLNLPLGDNQSIDYHIVTLLDKIEALRRENLTGGKEDRVPARAEIRTLEFWRAVTCECLASFVYVFVVCGAAAGSGSNAHLSSVMMATALAAGATMTTLTQCFGPISGAHVNPAVSVAMGITKNVSFLRATMFVIAQCGGGIAGAAFLYGVTVPGYQGNLAAAVAHTASVAAWERFGVEFILTFIVVLTYFVSMDKCRRWTNTAAITIGASYAACTFVSMPYLNPARSLGPSFVLNKWDNHWVYWLGPSVGGAVSGLVYDYILNPRRHKRSKESTDGDSSSIHSDEDTYDDLDKPTPPKFHGSTYNTYRPAATAERPTVGGYCPSLASASLYSAPASKLERVESLYGGTKSLYCKSPPLTRANLNRSQSVYTKSNSGVHKDNTLPRPGPLVPAQSLYPMRLNQPNQTHVQNQNAQNQMQQRSESIYGVRGITPGTSTRSDNYAPTRDTERVFQTRQIAGATSDPKYEENTAKQQQTRPRPDSMYGAVASQNRREEPYSYHGANQRNQTTTFQGKVRQSPPTQLLSTSTGTSTSSYHHSIPQCSPNSQY